MVLPLRRDHVARGLVGITAAAVFLGCWELLHHWFYVHGQIVDTPTYQGYGLAMRGGILPYRDFPVEYPPGALAVFVAPTYVGSYASTFGWMMAALGVCCLLVAMLAGAAPHAVAFIAISPMLIGSMAYSRFDFWPTLFVAGALAALLRDRHRAGWALLGAAVSAKLFALALLPIVLVWTFRRRGGRALASAVACGLAVVGAAFVPFLILAPSGLWHSLSGEASRPLQIESLAASFLTTFSHPRVIESHGSLDLAGQGTLAAVTTVVELIVLLALWIGFARGPATPERFIRYFAACLCAFIALGKVLSPQFLIWLVPIVPLVRGRRGLASIGLLAAAFTATAVFFPARYFEYIFHLHLAWVVLVRNLMLVALLCVLSGPDRKVS